MIGFRKIHIKRFLGFSWGARCCLEKKKCMIWARLISLGRGGLLNIREFPGYLQILCCTTPCVHSVAKSGEGELSQPASQSGSILQASAILSNSQNSVQAPFGWRTFCLQASKKSKMWAKMGRIGCLSQILGKKKRSL